MTPPAYEPGIDKNTHKKAERGDQALEHQYSGVEVGLPVGFAELDSVSPVSPVRNEAFTSVGGRNASLAQNF